MGGGGLYSNMQLVSNISPPPQKKKSFTRPLHTLPITMATSFRIESTVRGHHVYKASWSPYIGEELPVQCEVNKHSRRLRCSCPQEQQHCRSCTTGNFQSLLVLPAQEWQRDDLYRQWWQETIWSWWERTRGSVCVHLQRETKTPWETDKPVC